MRREESKKETRRHGYMYSKENNESYCKKELARVREEVENAGEKEKSYLKIEKSKITYLGGGGNYSIAGEVVVRARESRYRPSES